MSVQLSGCGSRYEKCENNSNPGLELGCSQASRSPSHCSWEAAGTWAKPREGRGQSGRRAELALGALLAEGRQRREAGHSTRLAGKYLEGCFHMYKNSARLLGSVCRGWEGSAGPRPARKPVQTPLTHSFPSPRSTGLLALRDTHRALSPLAHMLIHPSTLHMGT